MRWGLVHLPTPTSSSSPVGVDCAISYSHSCRPMGFRSLALVRVASAIHQSLSLIVDDCRRPSPSSEMRHCFDLPSRPRCDLPVVLDGCGLLGRDFSSSVIDSPSLAMLKRILVFVDSLALHKTRHSARASCVSQSHSHTKHKHE